jgi:hypothetical protein
MSFMLISSKNTCLNNLCNSKSCKQIVSLNDKLKNAILILIQLIFKFCFAAFASRICKVIYYTTNANVLK